MGEDDQPSAAAQSQQRAELPYEVATGEHIDDHTASAGITIRPGSGIDSVRVRVPGMDEFETGPDQLRDWLQQNGLVHTPQQWTNIDQQLQDAIQRGHASADSQLGAGSYHWDDYETNRPGLSDPQRDEIFEQQSADWTRMLNAWAQFQQQVADLRSVAGDDAETIIRQVGHTITALNMIESAGWTHSCANELGAWESLSTDGLQADAVHAAAAAVADAGDTLYRQWHSAIEAGNYDSTHLNDSEAAFVASCAQARAGLHS